ncbi:4'-phosphopantetheinyl transferase superfamily protein [Cellulomonas cellasea]|uniref:4'-phosphopantetheinyl transferase n=1 Tax=Cellulomonas cellasea TaxID=43670 RepID=A0A7W4UH66_9CELL|nr:4'-phosphopantetheinyl transferase superfamily protein [Cellulomonas cellasea]MBB2923600.1 4'-phosphopantetheinyl transferase [Cellulomonas cellasea]
MSRVHVLVAAPADVRWLGGAASPAEEARAARFRDPGDRARSLVAAALLRRAVTLLDGRPAADVAVGRWCRRCARLTDHGRPVVLDGAAGVDPGLHLSVAHAGDVVVAAATHAGPVGVDVEREAGTGFDGFDDEVLSERERAYVRGLPAGERSAWRVRTWTRKEALLKATGHGLLVEPRTVDVLDPRDAGVRRPDALAAELLPPARAHLVDLPVLAPGHAATLVLLAPAEPEVALHRPFAGARDTGCGHGPAWG